MLLLHTPTGTNSDADTIDVAIAAHIDNAHVGVFVAKNGAWGLALEQFARCVCNSRFSGGGLAACKVSMRLGILVSALQMFPNRNMKILCTQERTRLLLNDWVDRKHTQPTWYQSGPHARARAPFAMWAVDYVIDAIRQHGAQINIPEVKSGADPLLDLAWHLSEVAANSIASPHQSLLLEEYFNLKINSTLTSS